MHDFQVTHSDMFISFFNQINIKLLLPEASEKAWQSLFEPAHWHRALSAVSGLCPSHPEPESPEQSADKTHNIWWEARTTNGNMKLKLRDSSPAPGGELLWLIYFPTGQSGLFRPWHHSDLSAVAPHWFWSSAASPALPSSLPCWSAAAQITQQLSDGIVETDKQTSALITQSGSICKLLL